MNHAFASTAAKVHVTHTKTRPYSLFVGYFPVSVPLENLLSFLQAKCRNLQRVSVGRMKGGSGRGMLICRVDFAARESALTSMNVLSGLHLADLQLLARPWVNRTEANERRDVGWRRKSWNRQERRLRERRNHRIRIDELQMPDGNVFWYRRGEDPLQRRRSD